MCHRNDAFILPVYHDDIFAILLKYILLPKKIKSTKNVLKGLERR